MVYIYYIILLFDYLGRKKRLLTNLLHLLAYFRRVNKILLHIWITKFLKLRNGVIFSKVLANTKFAKFLYKFAKYYLNLPEIHLKSRSIWSNLTSRKKWRKIYFLTTLGTCNASQVQSWIAITSTIRVLYMRYCSEHT